MADRQKVIDGLELCLKGLSDICPYKDSDAPGGCRDELMHDALVLLRAQEPREPHYTKLEYIVNGMPVAINHPECPRCYENGLVLWDAEIEKGAKYCKRCGQAVKWE